jgi:hypothetical protein
MSKAYVGRRVEMGALVGWGGGVGGASIKTTRFEVRPAHLRLHVQKRACVLCKRSRMVCTTPV